MSDQKVLRQKITEEVEAYDHASWDEVSSFAIHRGLDVKGQEIMDMIDEVEAEFKESSTLEEGI